MFQCKYFVKYEMSIAVGWYGVFVFFALVCGDKSGLYAFVSLCGTFFIDISEWLLEVRKASVYLFRVTKPKVGGNEMMSYYFRRIMLICSVFSFAAEYSLDLFDLFITCF